MRRKELRSSSPAERLAILTAENRRLKARIRELTRELERSGGQLRSTQDLELELLRAASLPQLLKWMIPGLRHACRLTAVRLILHDPQHEIRHLLAGDGVLLEKLEGVQIVDSLASLAPQLADLERPWFGTYRAAEHARLIPSSERARSLCLIPLKSNGERSGVLIFLSADPKRFSGELGSEFLAHLGVVAALCTENAVNRARLVRSGLTDFLTGFHNRRYLHARLREELARVQRTRETLVCLMIDVDHFKRINDKLGHLAGDAALREVARRIETQMRLSDTGARFGGDEFVIVLAGTLADGERVASRVLQAVRGQTIQVRPKAARTVTLSIGVAAALPRPEACDYEAVAERLIAAADQALYVAKNAGRNRVVVAEKLVS
jgi:diguanylate cyclase (GGDEF)-like protein